jgi:hypothetical protein
MSGLTAHFLFAAKAGMFREKSAVIQANAVIFGP